MSVRDLPIRPQALIVAAATVVLCAACGGGTPRLELVYRASHPVPAATIAQTVQIIRARAAAAAPGVRVSSSGNEVTLSAGGTSPRQQARLAQLAATGQLGFYDWEANVLTPTGRTVASLLPRPPAIGIAISQGAGAATPGSPGAGSLPLYAAVSLAASRPEQISPDNSRAGPEYFMFGAPGSSTCPDAARFYGFSPPAGEPCYLAGPEATTAGLDAAIPPGVRRSDEQLLTVRQGTVVLQAVPSSFDNQPSWSDPSAQFFVLRDHLAMSGPEITDPAESRDPIGNPVVAFGFTSGGAMAFQRMTGELARRGGLASGLGARLNQHFAVALDAQLLTVPLIDFRNYPDGVPGGHGAELTGGFSPTSAQRLARELQLGRLPVALQLVSVRRS